MVPLHIVLVDDDALLRRSVAFNLERAGYRVSTAANAEDALSLSQRDTPDLVLLDIALPGMDGLDALRQFRDRLQVPIIFLTGRRRELDQVLGLELGADDYITKPFDNDVLLARVNVGIITLGQGMEIDTIAMVVIGGTAMSGGKGGVLQSVIAIFSLEMLYTGIILFGLGNEVKIFFAGLILAYVVLYEAYAVYRHEKALGQRPELMKELEERRAAQTGKSAGA